MACTIAEFRARFPEFSDVTEYPDLRIQLFLDDAAVCYMGSDENRWCGKYDYAQCYLAAHILSLATATEAGDSSATAGPITNKTAGGVSLSYGYVARNSGQLNDWYNRTAYGQQFLTIRNTCFVGVAVANCL